MTVHVYDKKNIFRTMLYIYILAYKLISFTNFKIVSPATVVNK